MGLALHAVVRQRADAVQALEASRSALEQEAVRLQSSMKRLSRRMADAQETERRLLATELYEGPGRRLAVLQESLGSRPAAELRALLEEALTAFHAFALALRPAALGGTGLLATLRADAARVGRRGGPRVEVAGSEGESTALEPQVASGLLRIAQEALDNVARHASAQSVQIRLDAGGRGTIFTIRDDGVGFAPAERSGRGMRLMREQAEALGAALRIESTPGAGTAVTVELPQRA